MRITKDVAIRVANEMTAPSKEYYTKLVEDYENKVRQLYELTVPKEVADFQKKYPNYLRLTDSIWFSGRGFSFERVYFENNIVSNNDGEAHLVLTDESAKELSRLSRAVQKAKEAHTKLNIETRNALLTLKTYSKIIEKLPEAKPFLPTMISGALVVNFDSLRNKLEKQVQSNKQLVKK